MERSSEIEEKSEMDARCRIVVVSSSTETARVFVERVISLSENKTSNGGTKCLTDKGEVVIRHTLRNRYYEAEVWFWVVGVEKLKRELGGVGKDEEDGGFGKFDAGDGAFDSDDEDDEEAQKGKMSKAPAIVYVWDDVLGMERCRKEIGEIVRGMKRSGWDGEEGAEVCLAVRMGGGGEEGDGEGDVEVDGMFMEHGFEYVDGREGGGSEDVPGLPRVVDALSTVMWASMRSHGDRGRKEEMMSELLDIAVRRDGEEEEEFGEMVSSPVDMDMDLLTPFGVGVRRKVSMGFEDDFVQAGGYVALEEEEEAEIEQTAGRLFAGDLSSVFLSLQGVKGEIAAMEDEAEKRRIAARVALGLAYAFDLE